MSRITWAQAYPTRPVRIIAPFPAGLATDTIARLMGQSLSERLGATNPQPAFGAE
jgi:tripartite-type tricarboxylate transporter receptor subunit TctC